tara:strand:- start:33186 stop:33308 length:123 start_codon:yes stop_codon:yes gene_type:complete
MQAGNECLAVDQAAAFAACKSTDLGDATALRNAFEELEKA